MSCPNPLCSSTGSITAKLARAEDDVEEDTIEGDDDVVVTDEDMDADEDVRHSQHDVIVSFAIL